MSASTERRKANEKAFRKVRRAQSELKGIKPARDKAYRDWINGLPCVVCFLRPRSTDAVSSCFLGGMPVSRLEMFISIITHRHEFNGWASECCHVGQAGKGMRQKCSDYETIPMCSDHHREQHGPDGATFFERHPIPLQQAFAALRKAYEEQK